MTLLVPLVVLALNAGNPNLAVSWIAAIIGHLGVAGVGAALACYQPGSRWELVSGYTDELTLFAGHRRGDHPRHRHLAPRTLRRARRSGGDSALEGPAVASGTVKAGTASAGRTPPGTTVRCSCQPPRSPRSPRRPTPSDSGS